MSTATEELNPLSSGVVLGFAFLSKEKTKASRFLERNVSPVSSRA